MTGIVVPMQPGGNEAFSLTRIDVVAIELLAEGRAATLSAARLDAILAHLNGHRADLVAVIAELRSRPSSGDARIDALNANLSVEASKGLAQIDLFIGQAEICAGAARSDDLPT
ncbi:hypothetical protein [Methylobacterium pseudosasicola]|uniref:Uncharacterized protein n=1 Tax=Methylobacterium pseudosasicola TaxID=582667 RepID=A0A1I4T6G5_9HYPH|nr:hypothetical protein [Methylobacterium pseudosasicola]SFM72344.1 hypothetical protein SAMN05192568_105010 [Methylobacterium pseudosasicola]